MGLNALGLGIVLSAQNKASPVFKQVGQDLGKLKGQVGQAGQQMADSMAGFFRDKNGRLRDARGKFVQEAESTGKAAASGFARALGLGKKGGGGGFDLGLGGLGLALRTGAVAAVFAAPVMKANEFADALANVRAISGATAEQMEKLRRASLDAGLATQFDPTQAANALGDLASAGYNVEESIKILQPTLDLAAASLGQLSPSDAAGLAAQALKAFGLSAEQSAPTVDKLVQTMNLFAVQAKDLPLGLANSVRGASALGQSIDETLISFGLIRNIMPRVESAAMAVSTAMERMVDKKVQTAVKGLGVDIVDSTGKFRPFLDIMTDMLPKLEEMTEAKRADFLQTTFGAEALGGFNAIMTQVSKGITTSTGEVLKGGAAIAYLREQMANSAGTAGKFKDELLRDLPGQLRLLRGAFSTFLTVLGEPMAAALAPVVKGLVQGMQRLVGWFDKLSASAKKNIAEVLLAIGAVGLVLAAAGGPVTLALGAITAGILGIKYVIDNNIGGLGDKFRAWASAARLAWDAVVQLFTQGGFSGAVRAELNKAENAGIKNFAITVFVWFNRIKNFLAGVGEGFSAGMEKAAPAFKAFGAALERLGAALGLTAKNDPSSNMDAWAKAGAVGATIGEALADAIGWVVDKVAKVIEFGAGFTETFDSWGEVLGAVKEAAGELVGGIVALGSAIIGSTPDQDGSWAKFGRMVGVVFTAAANIAGGAFRALGRLIGGIANILGGVIDVMFGFMSGDWSRVWKGMKSIVAGVIKSIIGIIGTLVESLASAIDAMGKLAGKEFGAHEKAKAFLGGINDIADGITADPEEESRKALAKKEAMAAAETAALTGNLAATGNMFGKLFGMQGNATLINAIGSLQGMSQESAARSRQIQVRNNVTIELDKQVVAKVVREVNAEDAARSGGAGDADAGGLF